MKCCLYAAFAASTLIFCECSDESLQSDTRTITLQCDSFAVASPTTRASLVDEQQTDLWVYDGSVELVHQKSTDADFGQPTMQLTYGEHQLHVVSSRIANATITDGILSGDNPRATFAKDLTLDVTAQTAKSQDIQLSRQTYQLTITVDDEWPSAYGKLDVTLSPEYTSYNVVTGAGVVASVPKAHVVSPPASWAGTTGCYYTLHGFAPSADAFSATLTWTLYKADNITILQQHTITGVPLQRNCRTDLHGKFFGRDTGGAVSIDDEWGDTHDITF